MRGSNEFKRLRFHTVKGLKWAEGPVEKPSCIPVSRSRGSKALGRRYEKLVAKALPEALHGPWFRFEDNTGVHFCQPDFVLDGVGVAWVLECKLSDTPEAKRQLEELYLPVVHKALGKRTEGIVVAKRLTRATHSSKVLTTLSEAMSASFSRIPVVHWIGVGEL